MELNNQINSNISNQSAVARIKARRILEEARDDSLRALVLGGIIDLVIELVGSTITVASGPIAFVTAPITWLIQHILDRIQNKKREVDHKQQMQNLTFWLYKAAEDNECVRIYAVRLHLLFEGNLIQEESSQFTLTKIAIVQGKNYVRNFVSGIFKIIADGLPIISWTTLTEATERMAKTAIIASLYNKLCVTEEEKIDPYNTNKLYGKTIKLVNKMLKTSSVNNS